MSKVLSEAATVRIAPESVVGTAPAADWTQLQPNPGGIEMDPELETVERDPLSVYATDEKGDVVGLKANVKITQDLNMDWLRIHAPAMFRSAAKHPGGTGLAFHRPTAAVEGTPDAFTVGSLGALAAGSLIFVLGALNSANNGLHVVDAGSTGTSIKVTSTLVNETLPANAILCVVGFQFAADDLEINASNHLITAAKDLTQLGLVKGMAVIVSDEDTTHRFGTLPSDRASVAYLKSTPTANLAELEDHNWTVAGVDAGAGKTIRLYFGLYFQNRPIGGDADYQEATYHLELEDQDAATGNTVPAYTYGEGCAPGMFEINAPLKNKITVTTSYVGTDIPDPVLTADRVAGGSGLPGERPATAYAPLATAMFDTSNDLDEVKLYDSNGTLAGEVNSWKLSINHNVKPREVQGKMGAQDHIFGKVRPSVTQELYFTDIDQVKAARANRDLKWRTFIANHQGGFAYRMPYTALRQPKKSYAANEAVMFSAASPGFRDPNTNVVEQMTLFGYVPFGGDQNP
jgi:hypothetical protein